MTKIIEIHKCFECPHIETYLGGDIHGCYCTKMHRKKIEKINVMDKTPKWCPLEEKPIRE